MQSSVVVVWSLFFASQIGISHKGRIISDGLSSLDYWQQHVKHCPMNEVCPIMASPTVPVCSSYSFHMTGRDQLCVIGHSVVHMGMYRAWLLYIVQALLAIRPNIIVPAVSTVSGSMHTGSPSQHRALYTRLLRSYCICKSLHLPLPSLPMFR